MALVVIRQDLDMPLGKQIAQGSHAAGAVYLGAYDFERGQWKQPEMSLSYSYSPLLVKFGAMIDLEGADVVIEDQGHTVFNEPTITAGAFIPAQEQDALCWSKNPFTPSATDVRMALVANKKFRKSLSKDEFVRQGVLAMASALVTGLSRYPVEAPQVKANMLAWAKGSFAKIVLNAEESDMEDLLAKTKAEEFPRNRIPVFVVDSKFIVLGPAPKDELSPFTGNFKLL